ncbi:hypothetical protein FH972_024344 [Carpinus fangiana]|uniref:ubiquitinyl hydrolase 1 n=1 Tax=Carpinus fangiana TaxID=176857 RepID=A0A5N6KY77_9ROSI|nr:hypothetical protein FH972_024344 [Carpinus fangiana]
MSEHIHANLRFEGASSNAASLGTVLAGVVLFAFFLQRASHFTNFPLLSLPEYLWNGVVTLTPNWLVTRRPLSDGDESKSTAYAAKSQSLRSFFGLDRLASTRRTQTELDNGPKGLGNWDNSCFQNSVLQALSSLPSVASFVGVFDRLAPVGEEETTTQELAALMGRLNNSTSSQSYQWTPPKLKFMNSWQQQDAQEYYARISDDIEKDFVKALNLRTATPGLETLQLCPIDFSPTSLAQDISNPLEGLLAQRIGCTSCGYVEGISLVPFTSITLALPNMFTCDVAECLDGFTSLESIDGVECPRCTLIQARQHLLDAGDPGPTIAEGDLDSQDAAELDSIDNSNSLLETLDVALADEVFSDAALAACGIPKSTRTTSIKTRQVAVMRAPQCLTLHFNRSMFDETTGDLRKNYAAASYPKTLGLGQWCVGSAAAFLQDGTEKDEHWTTNPIQSMLPNYFKGMSTQQGPFYNLCAIVAHFGRHENGHYVCFRKMVSKDEKKKDVDAHLINAEKTSDGFQQTSSKDAATEPTWWRISDEKVSAITEFEVLGQEGAFMLFYEKVNNQEEPSSPLAGDLPIVLEAAGEADSEPVEILSPLPLAHAKVQ